MNKEDIKKSFDMVKNSDHVITLLTSETGAILFNKAIDSYEKNKEMKVGDNVKIDFFDVQGFGEIFEIDGVGSVCVKLNNEDGKHRCLTKRKGITLDSLWIPRKYLKIVEEIEDSSQFEEDFEE